MLYGAVLDDPVIRARLEKVGVLTKEEAIQYGALGPTARASGYDIDCRRDFPYAAYDILDWKVIVKEAGDTLARMEVRLLEMLESIKLMEQCLDQIPGGDILEEVREIPPGEGIGHIEAPRGECFHYLRSDGANRPVRHKIRAPTFMNFPIFNATCVGESIADATIILASVDPCYCCTERAIGVKNQKGTDLIKLSRKKTEQIMLSLKKGDSMFNTGLWILILPFGGALVNWLLGRIKRVRNYFTIALTLTVAILTFTIFPWVDKGVEVTEFAIGDFTARFALEPISLVFVMLISIWGFLAALYSPQYMEKEDGKTRSYVFLFLFLGTMIGSVMAGELFTLFILWELMTLSAFFLVIFNNTKRAIDAGIKYFIMSELGALAMLASIILLWHTTGNTSLSTLTGQSLQLSTPLNGFILGLFLVGFGVKAGLFPLHSWLPDAHPEAPSPISALLSGVMIKVGIFWLFRIFWHIFALRVPWQGVLLTLGALTILIGGLMALVQSDIKRLIAYSSISQIGYIILGIGLGTTQGIAGSLFHVINHALFKGLLFLGAGAVIYRCGSRKLDDLGGLAVSIPYTFGAFIVGALSLAGVPPLNGFFSKWILYQALIDYGSSWVGASLLTVALFGSTLTIIYIMKAVFSTFFGEPSSSQPVKEVGWGMRIALLVPALFCIIFGVYPQWPMSALVQPVLGKKILYTGLWNASIATLLLILGLAIGGVIFYLIRAGKRSRTVETFMGGEKMEGYDLKVRGSEMYNTIREITLMNWFYRGAKAGVLDPYVIIGGLRKGLTRQLRLAHNGVLSRYLAWILGGLVVVLWLLSIR